MQKNTLRSGKQIVRLVVLMVEVEQPEGISSRKLILETARHNVLTAYSGDGAVNLLQRFPNVDLAIIHTELQGKEFESTVRRLKETASQPLHSCDFSGGVRQAGRSGCDSTQLRSAGTFGVSCEALRSGDL